MWTDHWKLMEMGCDCGVGSEGWGLRAVAMGYEGSG